MAWLITGINVFISIVAAHTTMFTAAGMWYRKRIGPDRPPAPWYVRYTDWLDP